jgi:hypothetical protein
MPASYPDIDDEQEPSPMVDARIRETADGKERCIIFDRGGSVSDGSPDRWVAADEGWFIDLRDMR